MTRPMILRVKTDLYLLKEIWEDLCVQRFAIRKDSEDFEPPKSWRKFYHVRLTPYSLESLLMRAHNQVSLARQKQMEDDAGLRARNKYAAIAAEKQERSLVFNPNATPMKRARTNGCEYSPSQWWLGTEHQFQGAVAQLQRHYSTRLDLTLVVRPLSYTRHRPNHLVLLHHHLQVSSSKPRRVLSLSRPIYDLSPPLDPSPLLRRLYQEVSRSSCNPHQQCLRRLHHIPPLHALQSQTHRTLWRNRYTLSLLGFL